MILESVISAWVPPQILVGVIAFLSWLLVNTLKGMLVKLMNRFDLMESHLKIINEKFSNVVSVDEHTKSVTKIWEEINKVRERIVCIEARNDIDLRSAQQ